MELNLYIYSGLGNIIALIDLLREDLSLSPEEVVKIAELEGVEFDQLISILPPESPDVDLSAEIYNADGSIAKNCINGARCLTKFVVDEELSSEDDDRGSYEPASRAPAPVPVVPDPVAESTEEEEDDSLSYFSKLVNS